MISISRDKNILYQNSKCYHCKNLFEDKLINYGSCKLGLIPTEIKKHEWLIENICEKYEFYIW